MGGKSQSREQLFKHWRAGDSAALEQLFILERHQLYDYLLRMTGQVARSWDTVDEVENSFDTTNDEIPTLEDLRISIYRTARNFCADLWRADTSRLVNQAIEPTAGADGGLHINKKLMPEFVYLDQIIRTIKPELREILLLKIRGDFSDDATGDIMGLDSALVREAFRQGLDVVRDRCQGKISKYEFLLVELPLHPVPHESAYGSTNLSALISDLKESRTVRFRSSWVLVLTVCLVILVGALIFFYPGLFASLRSKLRF